MRVVCGALAFAHPWASASSYLSASQSLRRFSLCKLATSRLPPSRRALPLSIPLPPLDLGTVNSFSRANRLTRPLGPQRIRDRSALRDVARRRIHRLGHRLRVQRDAARVRVHDW